MKDEILDEMIGRLVAMHRSIQEASAGARSLGERFAGAGADDILRGTRATPAGSFVENVERTARLLRDASAAYEALAQTIRRREARLLADAAAMTRGAPAN